MSINLYHISGRFSGISGDPCFGGMVWGLLPPFQLVLSTKHLLPLGRARTWGSFLNPTVLHSATLYGVLPGLGSEELLPDSGQGASFTGILGNCSGASESNQGNFQPLTLIPRVSSSKATVNLQGLQLWVTVSVHPKSHPRLPPTEAPRGLGSGLTHALKPSQVKPQRPPLNCREGLPQALCSRAGPRSQQQCKVQIYGYLEEHLGTIRGPLTSDM